jgi:hypothetical protein
METGKKYTRVFLVLAACVVAAAAAGEAPRAESSAEAPLAQQHSGVVLDVGAPEAWDGSRVYNPTVVKRGAHFEMWYAGDPVGKGSWSWTESSIGLAYSDDGLNWTKHEGNPVLTDGGAPCVLYRDWGDGQGAYYKMWYRHYEGSYGGGPAGTLISLVEFFLGWLLPQRSYGGRPAGTPISTLAYATSKDGLQWEKHGIIAGASYAEGFGSRITSPSVLYLPDVPGRPAPYLLYYYAEAGDVRLAYSKDGIHWAPQGPVLGARPLVVDGRVLYAGGKFHMLYSTQRSREHGASIGYAVSEDGIEWRVSTRLALAAGASPNDFDFGIFQPALLVDGDEVRIWFACGPAYAPWGSFWGKHIGYADMPVSALTQ